MLHLSWHDSGWIPLLNASNVMDYFSERSNPFYDRQCNNEIIKMQRLSPEQLSSMVGIEYTVIHTQEPILYVIRQQHRHSPTQVTPLVDYYIVAGIVYQAPDLLSVVNSRLLNSVHQLNSAFDEAQSFSRYHPSKGYWWEFKESSQSVNIHNKEKKKRSEPSSLFQRQRVDMLLTELAHKFPPKALASNQTPVVVGNSASEKTDDSVKVETKIEVKVEKLPDRIVSQGSNKPPPEKKLKLIR